MGPTSVLPTWRGPTFRNPYASFNLQEANFLNADLREANLEAAVPDRSGRFTYADLGDAALRGAMVDQAELAACQLDRN